MKVLRIGIAFLCCFFSQIVSAQEYHTPDEIVKILKQSTVKYELHSSKLDLKEEQIGELPLNQQGVFLLKNEEGQLELRAYEFSPEAFEYFMIGDSSFQTGDMEEARTGYLKAFKTSPNNSQLMTFIGQTYEIENNDKEAKKWYKDAIKENYIDYLAHWFLADIYLSEGNSKNAVKEITIAHILNRNNPRIFERLIVIFNEKKSKYANWKFKPLYKLSINDDSSISLVVDPDHHEWMIYAFCKAIWAHEPGYRDSMLNDTQEIPSLVEATECLANVVIVYKGKNNDKKSDNEALNKLTRAVDENRLTEFILYEMLLIENPSIAYFIDKKGIDGIAEYIMKFRTQKS